MAHIDLSRSYKYLEYDGFEGIDSSKIHSGEGGIKNISDFRIRFDGAAEKRRGFEHLLELPGTPRAFIQVKESELLVLIENSLYRIDTVSRSYAKLDDLLFPSEGEAAFIEYRKNIYLIDGREVYVLFKDKLFTVDGYVPLYGSSWSCYEGGQVYEPFNLLSRHIRISFNLKSGGTSKIYLPFEVESIDAAFLDGKSDLLTRYTLSDNVIHVAVDTTFSSANQLLLYMTVKEGVIDRSSICSCRSALSYEDGEIESVAIFYGGNDPSVLLPSRPVSESECRSYFPTYPFTFDLYVTAEDAIKANDRGEAVTALCPRKGELIVFTEQGASLLYFTHAADSYLISISSCFGCSSKNGAIMADDHLITVSDHGVLKWRQLSYEAMEYDAVCISRKIHDVFGEDFARSSLAYHYKSRDEIWFCDPNAKNGLVVIYSTESDSWFSFTGIGAKRIFEIDGEICFIKDSSIFIFSRSATHDRLPSGDRPICGSIESGIIMLKPLNENKKLSHCIIRTSPGATLFLSITDAKGRTVTYRISDRSGERMGYMEKRLDLYRSRYYSFSISTEENAVIYGITFIAQD